MPHKVKASQRKAQASHVKLTKSNPLFNAANRIYQRNPRRFQKLIVWIHAMRRDGWADTDIVQALHIFEQRDAAKAVNEWWKYLSGLLRRLRTENMQQMAEQEKQNAGNIFANLAHACDRRGKF